MKRWIYKLVVFLLLGAVVNVAVAWGLVFFKRQPLDYGETVSCPADYTWPRPVPSNWTDPWMCSSSHSFGATVIGTLCQVPDDPDIAGGGQAIYQWGWPARSMESEARVTTRKSRPRYVYENVSCTEPIEDLQFVPKWLGSARGRHRRIPLRVGWPGFVTNTAFYALTLSLLWSSPFVVRRLIRRKRGLCVKCGYDLRGAEHDVCPECGAEVS